MHLTKLAFVIVDAYCQPMCSINVVKPPRPALRTYYMDSRGLVTTHKPRLGLVLIPLKIRAATVAQARAGLIKQLEADLAACDLALRLEA